MWRWLRLLFLLPWGIAHCKTCNEDILYCPWAVYYGNHAPSSALRPFNPLVLDPDAQQVLERVRNEGKMLFGYISLGEISSSRKYFREIEAEGLLLGENPRWPGSRLIDIRKEGWIRYVLDKLIPEIITQGFQGIFIDTLDNPIYLEQQDPETFAGMKKAAAQLVHLIRIYFPNVQIMLNRAYELLPEVGNSINIILAESLYTTYNFDKKIYEKVPQEIFQQTVRKLQQSIKTFPHLQIFSLDYWYPNQTKEIKKIYSVEREHGFRPYVTIVTLDRIIPEPK
jgi:polysaccharide biosynthesis protein PelA